MKLRFLSFVLIFTFLLAACSPAQTAARFPTGKFVAEDNKSYWEFKQDGTWSFRSPSGLPLEGTYTTAGNTYTETFNNALMNDATNCNKPATYTWSFVDSRLKFSTTSDKCDARKAWYTSTAFVLAR